MIERGEILKATVKTVTLHVDPELSLDVLLPAFYERIASALGVYSDNLRYDCTKINVARNIQTKMFEAFERRYPRDSVGMYWAMSGPKTEDALPEDTVELFEGFFLDGETPLPLVMVLDEEAA